MRLFKPGIHWLSNSALFLNILLAFLLVFERFLSLPAALQVVGRLHPALLHFPIAMVAAGGLGLLLGKRLPALAFSGQSAYWLTTANIAALTALAGLFLSHEGGYEAGLLNWHKYSGALLAFGTSALSYFLAKAGFTLRASTLSGLGLLALVTLCGHWGGALTHGRNYLLEPIQSEERPQLQLDTAQVFRDLVMPVIRQKCGNCHNEDKSKGDLVLTTLAGIQKGGKTGALFTGNSPDSSLLFQRLLLPETEKKHMPPAGKPQLSDTELQLLHYWIAKGHDSKALAKAYLPNDTLENYYAAFFQPEDETAIEKGVPFASEKKIQSLSSNYCTIRPRAQGSPLLEAILQRHDDFDPAIFKKLQSFKRQLVRLECTGVSLSQDQLNAIAGLRNLRELGLSNAGLKGKRLDGLKKLEYLEILKLSGNDLDKDAIAPLLQLPGLRAIFLNGNAVSHKQAGQWQQQHPNLEIEAGIELDSSYASRLNKPKPEGQVEFFIRKPVTVGLSHPLAKAEILYTLDGSMPEKGKPGTKVYKQPLTVEKTGKIKFLATLNGWEDSEVDSLSFMLVGRRPDSWRLLLPPNPKYTGLGDSTIFNGVKGALNFRDPGAWIGFQTEHLEVVCQSGKPDTLTGVTISTIIDIGSYIFPPTVIEIWGGNNPNALRKIGEQRFAVPTGPAPVHFGFYACPVKPGVYPHLKIKAMPIAKLPLWHPGKGTPGWLFVDEVVLN